MFLASGRSAVVVVVADWGDESSSEVLMASRNTPITGWSPVYVQMSRAFGYLCQVYVAGGTRAQRGGN